VILATELLILALVDSAPGHQESKREHLALFFHFSLTEVVDGVATLSQRGYLSKSSKSRFRMANPV